MRRILLTLLMCVCGCGSIDPDPLTDDEGNVIPLPDAYDTWLTVVSVSPGDEEISLRPTLQITFDTHIQDDLILDYDMVYLVSGGIRMGGYADWRASDKTLYWRPFSPLTDGLRYTLTVTTTRLESVTGAPPLIPTLPSYRARSTVELEPPAAEPVPTWADIDALILRKCASCHRDPEWLLNPLTAESMVQKAADGVDQLLVIPGDPADSYLMHKIIPDYPVRKLGVQPPEWSDATPLTVEEVRVFERWIEAGAP